jgi:hypothetical protein
LRHGTPRTRRPTWQPCISGASSCGRESIDDTPKDPTLFNPDDFDWQWSKPKHTVKKEQLPALHGRNVHTDTKWWAWHGLGENQLHFYGEKAWWPEFDKSANCIEFELPSCEEKMTMEKFIKYVSSM